MSTKDIKYYRDWCNSYWKIDPSKDALYLLWKPYNKWVRQSIPLSLSRFREDGNHRMKEVPLSEVFIEIL